MADEQNQPLLEIDPTEFRVPAQDEKGHDKKIRISVHPGYANQVGKVLESGWFPYETQHQLYRHAVKRHLEWLETLAPINNSVLRRTNAILEILADEEEADKFNEVIKKLEVQVGSYLGSGRAKRAMQLIRRVFEQVENMPEGDWKEQYGREIKERYGWLLEPEEVERRVGAGLMDLGDDEQ